MPAEIFADGDQDYIEKFNTVAQQAFDGDAAAGRLDDHIDGTADKHGASAIVNTPAGSIAATDVQAAINELDTEKQPIDATLTALAGVTTAADKLIYATGSDTFSTTDLTSAGRALLDDADASAQRTTLGLGTAATLASDTDTTLAANSDTRLATQKAVKAYVDALIAASDAVVFKGVTDCSANPNYPAADAGHLYIVSVAGKIGGASGVVVEAGDMFICKVDSTASGNQATVGANWGVIQTNINGALTTADLGVTVAALAGAAFTGLSSVTVNSATAALTLSNAGAGAALTADKQIVSTLATGTSPFAVASTTVVTNLNAQFLSGATFAAPGAIGGTTPAAAAFTTISATGQITSTLATGTAPFSVASTTNVANLNASSLNGATFAAPGTIGGGTPGAATFTTLTATGQVSLAGAAGSEALRALTTTSAANFLTAKGATTANSPVWGVAGSDTNINAWYTSKGTGIHRFATDTGDNAIVRVQRTTATATFMDMVADNGAVAVRAGGAYPIYFQTNVSATQVVLPHTASADRFLTLTGSNGGNPTIGTSAGNVAFSSTVEIPAGTAAAPGVKVGAGADGLYSMGSTAPAITAGGIHSFRFGASGTGANYPYAYSVSSGGAPVLTVFGSDTDISYILGTKGAGAFEFFTAGATTRQARVAHTAGATRYLEFTGSNGGNPSIATNAGGVQFLSPPIPPSYTVSTLPAVGTAGGMIYVSDESGGAVLAFSDGTNWRRVTDRAIVS